jgi:hypothetical protein
MISHIASGKTSNKPIVKKAPRYMHIMGALMDKLECGILCLENVPITHNDGRHCILVRDLSENVALGELIRSVVERFNRMNDVDISISSNDISFRDRFIYSYIVVVQQDKVKAELP